MRQLCAALSLAVALVAPALASAASSKTRPGRARRPVAVGHVVPDHKLRAAALPRPSGNVHIYSVPTRETLKVNIYNTDGSYSVEALQSLGHLLRCKRTGTARDIEPRLLALLSHVYDRFGERRIEVVSAYRNQARTTSYHYQGAATDLRIPGVKPATLRTFLQTLDSGGLGIGLYPRTGFVHVDVRPPPSYRWIDWSAADPDSPDKQPPRSLRRRKKPES